MKQNIAKANLWFSFVSIVASNLVFAWEKQKCVLLKDAFGSITVIENVFGFKQVLPLQEGNNVIGRRCVGTNINTPIETSDMSMDRRHCIINVKRNKQGVLVYTLQDAPSLTGTFLNNEILGDKDRIRIEDGAIVTIGATTFILRTAE